MCYAHPYRFPARPPSGSSGNFSFKPEGNHLSCFLPSRVFETREPAGRSLSERATRPLRTSFSCTL